MILALAAVAAVALGGCGAGSEATTSSAGAETAASAAGSEAAEAREGQGAPSSSPASPAGQGKGSSASNPTGPQGSGAKQGPPIAAPKGEREQAPTQAEREELTVADISLSSPALVAAGESPPALPAKYTCDGEGRWPELRWQGVPADSKELVLFVMGLQPLEGKLVFNWAVGGLDPSLEGIEAGRLPAAAVSGTNSFGHSGYEICPEGAETYFFALLALPKALSPRRALTRVTCATKRWRSRATRGCWRRPTRGAERTESGLRPRTKVRKHRAEKLDRWLYERNPGGAGPSGPCEP